MGTRCERSPAPERFSVQDGGMDAPVIENSPATSSFTISVDGERVGYAEYVDTEGSRTFTHTVVEKEHEGKGYATRLIKRAISDTRADGLRIVAECSMVAHWLSKHPELDEFVDTP
jgi:predicted GNAT family acetyltransferase